MRFRTTKAVRQGCLLSAVLFNILFKNLEDTLKRKQEGEWIIEKKKIWSIMYVDDVAIVANNKEEVERMIKKYKNYLKKRGLERNVKKK